MPTHTLVGVTIGDSDSFSLSSIQTGSWPELPYLWEGLWFVTRKEETSERHFSVGVLFPLTWSLSRGLSWMSWWVRGEKIEEREEFLLTRLKGDFTTRDWDAR